MELNQSPQLTKLVSYRQTLTARFWRLKAVIRASAPEHYARIMRRRCLACTREFSLYFCHFSTVFSLFREIFLDYQ